MVCKDGTIKLLDFGVARQMVTEGFQKNILVVIMTMLSIVVAVMILTGCDYTAPTGHLIRPKGLFYTV